MREQSPHMLERQRTIDRSGEGLWRSIYMMSVLLVVVYAGVNAVILQCADKNWGGLFWMCIGIPVENLMLLVVALALSPVVRHLTGGTPTTLYKLVAFLATGAGIYLSETIIRPMVHGW